jgi:uncharacterized membrane protein
MNRHQNDAEWDNPANWRAGWLHVYVAPRDLRLLVPMRPRWLGWTLNLGQRRTWVLLLGVFLLALLALGLLIRHVPPVVRASASV